MKKFVFGSLAAILAVLSVLGGVFIGVGMLAYSVWLIVLMVKGTVAVSFLGVCKVILCWICAGFCGWIWGLAVGFLSALCALIAGED